MQYQLAQAPFMLSNHRSPVLLNYSIFLLLFLLLQLSMDLQFVQIEHRQNVLKLMEICGLEMKEAYQLYIDCGYNFEAAVNRQFNPPPPQPQNQYPPFQPPVNQFQQEQLPIINNEFYEDDDDYKYSQFKRFMANGKSFDKKYPIRRHQTFFSRIIPKFFKGDEDDPFKKNLEKCIDKRINLKNTTGNLSEVLEWSWKEKYPALIMILDFAPATKPNLTNIFTDNLFVEQVLNQQFKVYGINALEYELQEELKIFFNLQRDVNHFIVCRVNHLEEIQVLHRIKISQPYEQFKKKLKLVKSECIQLEMEESNIVKQYQEERRGNFNYKRPRTIKENIKYKEDRKIRQQQEEQFFKACKPKQEEKPQRQQKPEKKQQEKKPQKKVQKQEQLSQEKVKKLRQSKFASLKRYSSGIGFKIRLPSGSNIVINVDPEETVQYLFDYISNQPSDLGFADELRRQFDIFVGFGGSMRLRGKQGEQLKTLFEDSQVLIVRQTAE